MGCLTRSAHLRGRGGEGGGGGGEEEHGRAGHMNTHTLISETASK